MLYSCKWGVFVKFMEMRTMKKLSTDFKIFVDQNKLYCLVPWFHYPFWTIFIFGVCVYGGKSLLMGKSFLMDTFSPEDPRLELCHSIGKAQPLGQTLLLSNIWYCYILSSDAIQRKPSTVACRPHFPTAIYTDHEYTCHLTQRPIACNTKPHTDELHSGPKGRNE